MSRVEPENVDVVRTVGELVERLSAFPADTPVLATWEGVMETMGVSRELYHGRLLILADEIDRVYRDHDSDWY